MYNRREAAAFAVGFPAASWWMLSGTLIARPKDNLTRRPAPLAQEVRAMLADSMGDADAEAAAKYISAFGADFMTQQGIALRAGAGDYATYTARLLGLPHKTLWDEELVNEVSSRPRCACPDIDPLRVRAATDTASLGANPVEWWVEAYHVKSGREQWEKWLKSAWDSWSAVCGVRHFQSQSKHDKVIVHSMGRGRPAGFDGPSGILAWAMLPDRPKYIGSLLNRYDSDERWNDAGGIGNIAAPNVMSHEIGHLLGLDHSGNSRDLMAPFYSVDIRCPKPGDINRVVARYGKPGASAPPPPPPPPPVPVDCAAPPWSAPPATKLPLTIDGLSPVGK